MFKFVRIVLNLVISGIPSIQLKTEFTELLEHSLVLNLVISGIPSILKEELMSSKNHQSFKPCYKWNTFNTINVFSASNT